MTDNGRLKIGSDFLKIGSFYLRIGPPPTPTGDPYAIWYATWDTPDFVNPASNTTNILAATSDVVIIYLENNGDTADLTPVGGGASWALIDRTVVGSNNLSAWVAQGASGGTVVAEGSSFGPFVEMWTFGVPLSVAFIPTTAVFIPGGTTDSPSAAGGDWALAYVSLNTPETTTPATSYDLFVNAGDFAGVVGSIEWPDSFSDITWTYDLGAMPFIVMLGLEGVGSGLQSTVDGGSASSPSAVVPSVSITNPTGGTLTFFCSRTSNMGAFSGESVVATSGDAVFFTLTLAGGASDSATLPVGYNGVTPRWSVTSRAIPGFPTVVDTSGPIEDGGLLLAAGAYGVVSICRTDVSIAGTQPSVSFVNGTQGANVVDVQGGSGWGAFLWAAGP